MWILLFVEILGHMEMFLWMLQVLVGIYLQSQLFSKDMSWFKLVKSLLWVVLCLPLPVPWVSQPVFTIISWPNFLWPSVSYELNPLSPHSISLDFSQMINFQPWPRTDSLFFLPNSQYSGKNFSSPFRVLGFTLRVHLLLPVPPGQQTQLLSSFPTLYSQIKTSVT